MSTASVKETFLQEMKVLTEEGEYPARLRAFAQELTAELSAISPEHSEELLSTLIAELALSAADQRRRKERRQKQAEGIAAAKARGVRFGRSASALPENFEETYQAWRDGELSLREAADQCDLPKSTFYNIVMRKENAADCAQGC